MYAIRTLTALSLACLIGTAATNAQAGDLSIALSIGAPPPARVWVAPVYQVQSERVWVAPVTQLQTQNVWHEPVTQDRVDQVWVPDRYEVRDVASYDRHGRRITVSQNVLVEAGHWQQTHTPVVVQAGYWGPEAEPVVVTPGYWQSVDKTVCVQEGYWSDAVVYAPPVVVVPPYRDGYYDHGYSHSDYGWHDRDSHHDRRGW